MAENSFEILCLTYVNLCSEIIKCRKCSNRTAKLVSRSVVVKATGDANGLRELFYKCEFCPKEFSRKEVTERKVVNVKTGDFESLS